MRKWDYVSKNGKITVPNGNQAFESLDEAIQTIGKPAVLQLANEKYLINLQNGFRRSGTESKTARLKQAVGLILGNDKLLKQFPDIAKLLQK